MPGVAVEVEYCNQDRSVTAPSDAMIPLTIRADANGVFSHATPASGWRGYAALTTADVQMPQDGVQRDVEPGAVIWVHFKNWK